MLTVLFWGSSSGTVPEVLGHETGTRHSPTCRLRVALQDFFLSPASMAATTKQPDTRVEIQSSHGACVSGQTP